MGALCGRSYAPLGGALWTGESSDNESTSTVAPLADSSVRSQNSSGEESGAGLASGDALKLAVVAGNVLQVRALLRGRADANHTYAAGLTALHFAAVHNHVSIAQALIDGGASITAETTDENRLTPLAIAHMEGHQELFDMLCEDPPPKDPLRRRFIGPCRLAVAVGGSVVLGLYLLAPGTQWDGWEEEPPTFASLAWYKAIVVTMALTCISLVALVNMLDPGMVERNEVEYVERLRALPEDMLVVKPPRTPADDETFAVLRTENLDEPTEMFRWCRSCKFWRPPGVSHCSECRCCFWRFDHHCYVVGNCVAMCNHRFFVLLLLSGSIALVMSAVAVAQKLAAHGELASPDVWWPPRASQWALYLTAVFMLGLCLAMMVLVPFTCFHTGALLGNFTTKQVLRPKSEAPRRWLNDKQELHQLFCSPIRWRASQDFNAFGCRDLTLSCKQSG